MTTRPPRPLLAALACALLLAACQVGDDVVLPQEDPTEDAEASPTPTAASPERAALAAGVAQLRATVAATREALEAAQGGDTDALATALGLLVAEPTGVVGEGVEVANPGEDTPPLLPGPDSSREETVAYGDLLTTLLGASRSAGGAGEPVQRLLADPLAGDLGAWQRAPGDQLALVVDAADAPDLDAAEPDVLALQGEALRALAWTVMGAQDATLAPEAAGRALAHLTVVEVALDDLDL